MRFVARGRDKGNSGAGGEGRKGGERAGEVNREREGRRRKIESGVAAGLTSSE